jgi:hypothetical protein
MGLSDMRLIDEIDAVRRHDLVEKAISVIHQILLEGSDGSLEETEYLYSAVALELAKTTNIAVTARLLKREVLRRSGVKCE